MKRLDEPGVVEELIARLRRVTPDTSRVWGTMTPHEMVCHLTDSYGIATGERQASLVDTWSSRTIVRFIALHTPLKWPQGVPTRPEVDPKRQGTRPDVFERDRDRLQQLIVSFAERRDGYAPHPMFGALRRDEWMIWGYKHPDHHFRQFGV
jgi:Protein of unknown function (DUF1569)